MVRSVSSEKPLVNNSKFNSNSLNHQRSLLLFYSAIKSEKTKKDCEGKLFSLHVIYYLNKNSTIEGKYQKDLDNMTKIVSDTLTDYLTAKDKQNKKKTGLGLIRDDKDIHEQHLAKKFVDDDSEQGYDIALYKLKEKPHLSKNS